MSLLKNRSVNVKLQKDEKITTPIENPDIRPIEDKTGAVLKRFEKVGWKVFGCVCIYVLLDTFRQVQIARANEDYIPED